MQYFNFMGSIFEVELICNVSLKYLFLHISQNILNSLHINSTSKIPRTYT